MKKKLRSLCKQDIEICILYYSISSGKHSMRTSYVIKVDYGADFVFKPGRKYNFNHSYGLVNINLHSECLTIKSTNS